MNVRRKLVVASNSLIGHISWYTHTILTANEEVNGADADNGHGKNGVSANKEIADDIKETSIKFVLAFYKYIWRL